MIHKYSSASRSNRVGDTPKHAREHNLSFENPLGEYNTLVDTNAQKETITYLCTTPVPIQLRESSSIQANPKILKPRLTSALNLHLERLSNLRHAQNLQDPGLYDG